MNAYLLETLTGLRDTQSEIANIEKALMAHPDRMSLSITLDSLRKRHVEYEQRFLDISNREFLDVCSYRMFGEGRFTPLIASIGNALSDFQKLITVVYDAVKHGPKIRARLSPDSVVESSLTFGYSFPGSLGVVMTVPKEHLMFLDTYMDMAVKGIFEMASSESSDQIAHFAKRFGAASIRQMLQWASDHTLAGMGADIEWIKGPDAKSRVVLENTHLLNLTRAISETSDDVEEVIRLEGTLVAMDTKGHRFKFEVEGAEDIKGEASEYVATSTNTVELPKPYIAELRKSTHVNYATDTEEEKYYLFNLLPPES